MINNEHEKLISITEEAHKKILNLQGAMQPAIKTREDIENEGLRRFYNLRDHWSWHIALYLYISLFFQIITTLLLGYKKLNFAEYGYFINLVLGENFIQFITLALIVVKFLYKDQDTNDKKITPH